MLQLGRLLPLRWVRRTRGVWMMEASDESTRYDPDPVSLLVFWEPSVWVSECLRCTYCVQAAVESLAPSAGFSADHCTRLALIPELILWQSASLDLVLALV